MRTDVWNVSDCEQKSQRFVQQLWLWRKLQCKGKKVFSSGDVLVIGRPLSSLPKIPKWPVESLFHFLYVKKVFSLWQQCRQSSLFFIHLPLWMAWKNVYTLTAWIGFLKVNLILANFLTRSHLRLQATLSHYYRVCESMCICKCTALATSLALAKSVCGHGLFFGSELKCLGVRSWVHKRDIESHKERAGSDFPAGSALCGPLSPPLPQHIGWQRNTAWPEDGNSDDVMENHGRHDDTIILS